MKEYSNSRDEGNFHIKESWYWNEEFHIVIKITDDGWKTCPDVVRYVSAANEMPQVVKDWFQTECDNRQYPP